MNLSNTTNILTIVIPAFNEERTINSILNKVSDFKLDFGFDKEIIVINDCSADATEKLVFEFKNAHPELNLKYFKHEVNLGKGAAIHQGIKMCTGKYVIVQDADLEYDPAEINLLLKPAVDGYADIVYGSRFIGGKAHRILFFLHSIGNKILTFASNAATNLNLTDMETCYKLFDASMIKTLDLKEKRFGFEPEVTAKISRIKNVRIYEVGVSYYGRTYEEGKKINWKDGFRAFYCILKYGFLKMD